MSMTRQHFQVIADCLRDNKPDDSCPIGTPETVYYAEKGLWASIVGAFADRMATQNVNFDRARFERACGLDEE